MALIARKINGFLFQVSCFRFVVSGWVPFSTTYFAILYNHEGAKAQRLHKGIDWYIQGTRNNKQETRNLIIFLFSYSGQSGPPPVCTGARRG